MFSLESPHRGDSNEYTQYNIFNMKKEKHPKSSQIRSFGIFSKGLKSEFETAMVNEPSVFEPMKFYCISTFNIDRLDFFHKCTRTASMKPNLLFFYV